MRRWIVVALAIVVGASMLMWLGPLVDPPASASGDNRYGLDFISSPGTVASATRFGQATATGAGWDRFPLYWNAMQSSRGGAIDFSGSDATVSADLARGIAVQGILVGAPGWATSNGQLDLDGWSSFVSQTVTHYRGQVHAWEMWNEPDLLDGNGNGQYWTWGVPAYYQLLKVGYLAAKAADPSVTVLMGGLAFPYNNQDFFPQLLAQMAQDPTAAANHGYFDVLPFHSYDRVARMYELPLGYFGTPSFTGFWPLLRKYGLSPSIWVNELGVPIWDYASGQNAPGRATQDEQASYLVEAIADGLAAGVDHFFAFQLYDDGAGAIDPHTNLPAEYFGLVSNGGATRPGYQAYQSAISLFSGTQAATHLTVNRGSEHHNAKGLEVVTLYGTSRGKVTVAWNDDPGNPVNLAIPTDDVGASVLDKFGHTVSQVIATNNAEAVTLPGATNNNNFDCYTPHGCDPNDYIIGGSPVILVENDATVPPVVFDPLPLDSVAPITLSWHSVTSAGPPASYDVQYRDAADGVWHDLATGTNATSALFGDGSHRLLGGHSYEFRLRSYDGSGNLLNGFDYPSRPLASTVVIGGNVVIPPAPIDARIEILWPHGNLPVAQATQANLTAALYQHGATISVNSRVTDTLHLWQALDNGVAQPVATGVKRTASAGSLTYPLWDFNDVDVSAARDPSHRYYFWVSDDNQRVNSTIWSHGVDARTFFPQQDVPTGVLTQTVTAVDAKIEIVWPHASAPVSQATLVNVGVELFAHGTLQSVPVDFGRSVQLYQSTNTGGLEPIAMGTRVLQTTNGLTYPTWQFNDVDVSAARDPNNRIYFRLDVPGVTTYSNVWTHGVDARTHFPKQDVPTAVAP
jgi:hypothetical protein